MDGDTWPKTNEAAAALVALALAEIIDSDKIARDQLLAGFMKSAWPSPRASRQ